MTPSGPTPDKAEIARGYNQIPVEKFMPQRFHQRCVAMVRPHLKDGMAVADLGCGQGTLLQTLRELPLKLKLSACDLSPVLVDNTRKRVPEADVRVADIESLPFADAAFDAVFVTEVMEHLATPQKALGEILRVLKPGGRLLVSLPNRDWFHFDRYVSKRSAFQPVDDHFYRVAEFEGFLRTAGFTVELVRGGENLYFGGGLPRLVEKVVLWFYPPLHRRMKRMILLSHKSPAA